jgi:hypothetical protein
MVPVSYHTSRADPWAVPRWRVDPLERRRIYGPIHSMDEREGLLTWIGRLFGH